MPTITFDFRTRGAEQVRRAIRGAADEAARLTGRTALSAAQEQAAAQAALRGAAAKKRASADAARELQRIEQQTTAIVQTEVGRRVQAEAQGARHRVRAALAYLRDHQRAEQEATRVTQREARARQRSLQAHVGRVSSAVTQTGGALAGAGVGVHGAVQDARRARAEAERTALNAFRQGGASNAEALARVREMQAFAADKGMRFDDLARAASASQAQFSTLQGDSAASRGGAFQRFLASAQFARDSGNDVGEVTRLQGFFAQQGFDSGTQQQLLRFAAGAANRGSVELGNMTREALMPITQRIQTALSQLSPMSTPEQRQRVAVDTFRQGVAELQVEALGGTSARRGGMALSSVAQFLTDPNRQDKMRTNILNARQLSRAQREALDRELFTRGPGGRRTLATTNPLEFVERFQRVLGNNPLAMQTIFAGGGHGNPQSLLVNQRAALSQLMSLDPNGRSRVRALMDPSVSLTDSDLAGGAQLFGQDTLAQLNRNEELRLTALTDNSNRLVELSNRVAELTAQFPILTAALAGAGGASGILGAGGSLARAGVGLLGGGATAALGAVGAGGLAATMGTALTGASAAAVAGTVGAGAALGGGLGEGLNRLLAPRNADGSRRDNESIFTVETWRNFAAAVRDAFASNPPVVQISPQAAVHAAGVAASGASSPPPEARASR